MDYEPEFLMFVGTRTWGVVCGVAFLGLSVLSIWLDRRRGKRTHADQMGCVPWMTLSVILVFAAAAAFLFALKSR